MTNEEVRALISEDVLIRLHGYYACAVEPTRQDHDCITAADALTALLARAEAAESALATVRRDAERYLAWRDSHTAGMRPFLPSGRMPATSKEAWTYPFEYDPPDDAWTRSTPSQRGVMIDAYIDAALAEQPKE